MDFFDLEFSTTLGTGTQIHSDRSLQKLEEDARYEELGDKRAASEAIQVSTLER